MTTYAINEDAARYAIIFAADAGPEALYGYNITDENTHRYTDDVVELATLVGNQAERLRKDAEAARRDFFPVAYAEQAAQKLRSNPQATLDELFAAGQAESDSIAGLREQTVR